MSDFIDSNGDPLVKGKLYKFNERGSLFTYEVVQLISIKKLEDNGGVLLESKHNFNGSTGKFIQVTVDSLRMQLTPMSPKELQDEISSQKEKLSLLESFAPSQPNCTDFNSSNPFPHPIRHGGPYDHILPEKKY